jgi:hypothetical protein
MWTSRPRGYRLTGFTWDRLETFGYVGHEMSYDDAHAVLRANAEARTAARSVANGVSGRAEVVSEAGFPYAFHTRMDRIT